MMTRPILLPLPNAPSDAELVARAMSIEGDRFGRELIYRRHAAYLLAMVTRLVSSREGAEAIVRETFVLGVEAAPADARDDGAERRPARLAVAHRGRPGAAAAAARAPAALLSAFGAERDDGDHDAHAGGAGRGRPAATRRAQDLEHVDGVLDRAGVEPRIAWMLRRVEGLALDEVAAACALLAGDRERRIAEIDARLCERFGTPAESP